MGNLIVNEFVKIFKRKSTYAMFLFLILIVVGGGFLTKYLNSLDEPVSQDNWKEELARTGAADCRVCNVGEPNCAPSRLLRSLQDLSRSQSHVSVSPTELCYETHSGLSTRTSRDIHIPSLEVRALSPDTDMLTCRSRFKPLRWLPRVIRPCRATGRPRSARLADLPEKKRSSQSKAISLRQRR